MHNAVKLTCCAWTLYIIGESLLFRWRRSIFREALFGIFGRFFCFGLPSFKFLQLCFGFFRARDFNGFSACCFRRIQRPFIRGDFPLFEAVIDEFAEEGIEDGAERDEDEHAGDAHEFSADSNGKEDPDAGEADRGADDVRIDQFAFNLLEYKEHDEEGNSKSRADH